MFWKSEDMVSAAKFSKWWCPDGPRSRPRDCCSGTAWLSLPSAMPGRPEGGPAAGALLRGAPARVSLARPAVGNSLSSPRTGRTGRRCGGNDPGMLHFTGEKAEARPGG